MRRGSRRAVAPPTTSSGEALAGRGDFVGEGDGTGRTNLSTTGPDGARVCTIPSKAHKPTEREVHPECCFPVVHVDGRIMLTTR